MPKFIPALLLCSVLSSATLVVAHADPVVVGSPPPEIIHTITRPLCSALQNKIRPSIGMLLQNDETIGKSPAYFKEYGTAAFAKSDAGKSLNVMRLSTLVIPLADNVLAIQKVLNDPIVFPANERTSDDKAKNDLKRKLLEALAQQQAALDLINGFVETQNLADMQHDGFGFIWAIASSGSTKGNESQLLSQISATPDPMHPDAFDDTVINAGLPTNPYEVDLSRLPGLQLGFNPVNKIKEALEFTQNESKRTEGALAKSVLDAVHSCGGGQQSKPN